LKETLYSEAPVAEDNSTASAYKAIRQMIVEQKLIPGSKFNQVKLAEELGISRTPVVKALHKLEAEGLVDNIPQKGFFVHQLTVSELLELFSLREALDTIILNGIVANITVEQLDHLDSIIEPFGEEWTPEIMGDYWLADQAFHNTLMEFSNNSLAKKVNDTFQVLNRTYRGGLVRHPGESLKEHRALLAALKARDAKTARKIAIEHISKGREILEGTVEKLLSLGVDPAKLPVQDVPQKVFSV